MNYHLTEIALSEVKYDQTTGLFPYSTRIEIDQQHIQRLVKSIQETGFWTPVLVRTNTMEGIAGNHRFLAALEVAKDRKIAPSIYRIPAFLADCDEGQAILLSFLENDFRVDFTELERTQGILKSGDHKPDKVESILDVNQDILQQLSFWPEYLNHYEEMENRNQQLRSKLSKQWIEVIHEMLVGFPNLQKQYITQLRNPMWVHTMSIERLKQDILLSIFATGKKFKYGQTWNPLPTPTCMESFTTYENFVQQFDDNPKIVNDFGIAVGTCKHLRFRLQNINQFSTNGNGQTIFVPTNDFLLLGPGANASKDGKTISGTFIEKPILLNSYCLDPKIKRHDSCFLYQENQARKAFLKQLNEGTNRIVSPKYIDQIQALGNFLWENPIKDKRECTPQNCIYQGQPQCCVVEIDENKKGTIYCIEEVCGKEAKKDQAHTNQQLLQEQQEEKLHELTKKQVAIVDEYFFSGKYTSLEDDVILDLLEDLFTDEWTNEAMRSMATGILNHHEHQGTGEDYQTLRKEYVKNNGDRVKWLICLLGIQM